MRGLFSHSFYKHVHKAAHLFIEMLKKSFFIEMVHKNAVGFIKVTVISIIISSSVCH